MAAWNDEELADIAAAKELRIAPLRRDVLFEETDHALDDEIDEEYRRKYGRSSASVASMTSPKARSTTIRLVPS